MLCEWEVTSLERYVHSLMYTDLLSWLSIPVIATGNWNRVKPHTYINVDQLAETPCPARMTPSKYTQLYVRVPVTGAGCQ